MFPLSRGGCEPRFSVGAALGGPVGKRPGWGHSGGRWALLGTGVFPGEGVRAWALGRELADNGGV